MSHAASLQMVEPLIHDYGSPGRGAQAQWPALEAAAPAVPAALTKLPGVRRAFTGARFHEAVLLLDRPVAPVLEALAERGIEGGYDLARHYPELGPALLVCATETKTLADIDCYGRALGEVLRAARAA